MSVTNLGWMSDQAKGTHRRQCGDFDWCRHWSGIHSIAWHCAGHLVGTVNS